MPRKNRNKYYDEIYEDLKNDFIQAKKKSPDLIIVLAHMGTHFYIMQMNTEMNGIKFLVI